MIQGYIGPPGCGKTTILAALAQKNLQKIKKGKSPYKIIYSNVQINGCAKFQLIDIKRFHFENCLILLDELTLDADSRDYKSFPDYLKEWFTLHRHFGVDIIYAVQDPSRIDKTIRNLTFSLWYVSRSVVPFFSRFVRARRIFRNLAINEYTSELTLGYRFAKFLEVIFSGVAKIFYAPRYYNTFDSYDDYGSSNKPNKDIEYW